MSRDIGMPKRSGRSERNVEDRLVRLLDEELLIKNEEEPVWEIKPSILDSNIDRLGMFVKGMNVFVTQEDMDRFENKFILVVV